jgi:cytochrome c peroxidase
MRKANVLFLFIAIAVWSCVSTIISNSEAEEALFYEPEGFPLAQYKTQNNPVTEDGFLLGKRLFYDGNLSRDGTISCAECHNQNYAFTHHGHALSHGIDNQVGIRNAPALQNLAWQKSFLWDGGVFDLDLFPLAPIENPVEMDENLSVLINKLKKDSKYPDLFEKAFGTSEITTERFLKALSQFMISLISSNSKYDLVKKNQATFSTDEKAGYLLFKEKGCVNCHTEPLFTDETYRSNGLDTTYFRTFVDYGRKRITEQNADKFKFKVPSLRNIEYTFPYMHDGRYSTLEAVMEHYSDQMSDIPNLDPTFKKNTGKIGIQLTAVEKKQMVAFLKTLTDSDFLKNKKFAP